MTSPLQLLLLVTLSFHSVVRSETVSKDATSLLQTELRSAISILETRISERVEELKRKDDSIKALENSIEDKLGYIASLTVKIESLQKGSSEVVETKASMNDKCIELGNQADNLRKDIDAQMKKRDDLEVRIFTAEKKMKESYLKLSSLKKISNEQRAMISKIKRDIRSAEEKLVKLRIEASLASEEMNQVYGGWFPPGLAASVFHYQTYAISLWTKHGRPGMDWAIERALDVKAIVEVWAGPYIEVIKTETKQFLKPWLTQISDASKPQIDVLIRALKCQTIQIVKIYRRLIKSVMIHHTEVQETILELLKSHEYTRPFADEGIAWYLASTVFALPAILIVNLFASLVSNKPQKRSHKHRVRRRVRPKN